MPRRRGKERGEYIYFTKEDMLVTLSSITMNKRDLPPDLEDAVQSLEAKLWKHLDLPIKKFQRITNGTVRFEKYRLYTDLNLIACPDGSEIEAPDMFTLLNEYNFDSSHLSRDVVVMTKREKPE